MKKRINLLIGISAVCLVSACAPLVDYYAFMPQEPPYPVRPIQAQGAQLLKLDTSDGEILQALRFRADDSAASKEHITLYLTGNAGHIYDHAADAQQLTNYSHGDVLLLSYRGFGDSTGRPSERGLYLDTQAALNYLKAEGFASENIYIYARSIGCAAAIEAAQQQTFAGLMLLAGFADINQFIEGYGYAGFGWVGMRKFDSLTKAPNLTEKVLWAHGTADEIVPYEQGRSVYAVIGSDAKQLLTLENADHNNFTMTHAEIFWPAISRFYASASQ